MSDIMTYKIFVNINLIIWDLMDELMEKADYLYAKANAIRQLRDRFARAGEVEAKRKAEKLLEDLKSEI